MKKQVLFPTLGNLFTTNKGGRSQATHFLSTILLLGAFVLFGATGAWGQIAQRGSATTNSAANTNATTLSINKPTGVVSGDVMLLTIVQNETDNDNGGLASPTLSGWSIVKDGIIRSDGTSNNSNLWFGSVYYRISDGTEAGSFSLTMHARCDMAIGSIVAFSGVASNALKPNGDVGGPFDVVPVDLTTANSATATATGLTVASNNSAVLMIAMVNNDRTYDSWSNSQTELFDHVTTNLDNASIGAAWTSCETSGATGNRTVTISSSDRNSALLLVLRSASIPSAGSASSAPTTCINSTLTNITHTTFGATGIGTATGLPTGVTAAWASNTITISGTPTQSGTFNYSIPLTVGCGSVSATGTITVTATPNPTATENQSFCSGATVANLSATGSGLKWYTSAYGGIALSTNTALSSGSYYVSQTVSGCESSPVFTAGLTSFGTSNSNSTNRGLVFDLISDIVLQSFKVQSNNSGSITVTLTNTGNNPSFSKTKTVTLVAGVNTINVEEWGVIPAGNTYKLLLSAIGSGMDLTRTTSFNFPLAFEYGSITGNNESGNTNRYNFFYDWKIIKARTKVTVTLNASPTSVLASSNSSTICAGGSVNLTSSATSNSNTATTILNQNFNGTPTGWTTTNTSSGGTSANAAWTLRANGYGYTYPGESVATFNSNDNSQFYLTNSASQGDGSATKTTLKSPSFSTVGLTAASLSFYHYFRAWSGTSAIVEISTNNGTSWSVLATYTADDGNLSQFVQKTINLSSYLNQANVSIRFRYNGGWGWYWAIDNVSINGTLSTPPSASFTWTSSTGAFTSSTQNPTGVSPSATTTYTVTATNNNGCTATANIAVTVNNVTTTSTLATDDYVWNGKISNDFTSAGNWSKISGTTQVAAPTAPLNSTNVFIPKIAQTCVFNTPNILNNTASVKNLIIEEDGALTMGSGSLDIHGNYSNSGEFTPGTGLVTFSAQTGNQTISKAGGETFAKLKINKAAGNVILANNVTVSTELSLVKGLLVLGSNDLILGGANLIDHSSQSYIKTSSTGKIKRNVGTTGSVFFPVGNSSYNPVELTNTLGSDVFSVSVIDSVFINGTSGALQTSSVVNRTWLIEEAFAGGNSVKMKLYWNGTGEQLTSFNPINAFVAHYVSSSSMWDNLGGAVYSNYVESSQAVSSFSPFTISSSPAFAPLPVELMSLDAQCAGENVIVAWKTASEHNSLNYVVERSEDGAAWNAIQTVAAAGNSNTVLDYAIEDAGAARGLKYYRLIQTDQDGAQKIYGPVMSNCGSDDNSFISFPNPGDGELTLVFNGNNFNGTSILNVRDANGRMVRTVALDIQPGTTSVLIPDMELTPGVYYLQLEGDSYKSKVIKHSLR